ncbi:MAG: SAM-dependent DNA methyltransferase [Lachnospiraceae bacterium]|nr:SAM-dependent DNA methyltransferase [Lachnospiraceae bacterium]
MARLHQMADELMGQVWLRRAEGVVFLNDFSLLLYGLRAGGDFLPQPGEEDRERVTAQILTAHTELRRLDYEFGRALRKLSREAWHEVLWCLKKLSQSGGIQESVRAMFDILLQGMYAREKISYFITPRTLAGMMAEMLKPKPGETVMDPVCGSGRLLAAAGEECRGCRYIGIDIDKEIRTAAFFHMAFRNMSGVELYQGDFLKEGRKETADVILANPPYSDDIHETVSFVEKIMDTLRVGGRCGILVPEGFLTNVINRDLVTMRQSLLDKYSLEGVISLPRKIYKPYTVSKSSLILLEKHQAKPEHRVFFSSIPEYDGPENEFSDRVYEQSMKAAVKAWELWKKGTGECSDTDGNEIFWTASRNEIREREYIFGAGHYQTAEYMHRTQQGKELWESIRLEQEELERIVRHYFREDFTI